ncbi:septal ring lytic transglycosylase RlpA family protein [Pontibacter actiniarum]|uniref:Probable endolytic peptidoglycan transglycosylase RlpA n=1 Tax=Pontibacter actiniarum TaxID=323450 RepID=A0A1X9YVL5_9BACT|nr:septal ring lytic transglycosylase RlpA family protein [Pontibacter actiniarum]ARS36967.1 septal ring lytic transglycosylase RlpA family lipoprotein [Pontibacter actiniarum]
MLTFLPLPRYTSFSRTLKGTVAAAIAAVCLSSCASSAPAFGEKGYTEQGKASYYARKFQGRKMANGDRYRRGKLTAAHKTLPFGTKVKVTNLQTKETVKVKITDRGPFVSGRVVDLSEAAAKRVGMLKAGVVPVRVKVVKAASTK